MQLQVTRQHSNVYSIMDSLINLPDPVVLFDSEHTSGQNSLSQRRLDDEMTFHRSFVKYWVPVILWMSFIFWMSSETFSSQNTASILEPVLRFLVPRISPQRIDLVHAFFRKAGHMIEYFILSLLLFRAFRGNSASSWNWKWPSLSLVILVLWAVLDEFHQSFVPTRTASAVDVGIDTAGGSLAQLVIFFEHRLRKR